MNNQDLSHRPPQHQLQIIEPEDASNDDFNILGGNLTGHDYVAVDEHQNSHAYNAHMDILQEIDNYYNQNDDEEGREQETLYESQERPGEVAVVGVVRDDNYDDDEDEDDDDDNEYGLSVLIDERQSIRIQTAPARPLTDIEDFKRSYEFLLLERAVVTSSALVQKDYQKFDLDSIEGQKVIKKYLSILERLFRAYDCTSACRKYRERFSNAYRILYKEGELSYLHEILDSAQEGFPYLYVNGEKFLFTEGVLAQGQILVDYFFRVQHVMRNLYTRVCSENFDVSVALIKIEVAGVLEKFDYAWAKFEKEYVMELMGMENAARGCVAKAIEVEKQLQSIEIREKIKGRFFVQSTEYINLRQQLCMHIAQMNAIANTEGKGRDDLGFEVLSEAEGILRRVSNEQSTAVRVLASEIKRTFENIRNLLRKYEKNIETVDPQLKNNADLVAAVNEYETAWEKGKHYFLDGKKCSYLMHFSHVIETTANKYESFRSSVECREADVFMSIPCLLILQMLDRNDKGICEYFLPQIGEEKHRLGVIASELRAQFDEYRSTRKEGYKYYNTLERVLLGVGGSTCLNGDEHSEKQIVHRIKQLAIEMQRNQPVEWNGFLDAAVSSL